MGGGGFVDWLGFRIPVAIVDRGGERDAWPSPCFCALCKRMTVRGYVLATHDRVCAQCIEDTIRVVGKRRIPWMRPLLPAKPSEYLPGGWAIDPAVWRSVA